METEVAGLIRTERHERTPNRLTQRNGCGHPRCSPGTSAYRQFPKHQRQLRSTGVLERLNKEIKRRSNVVVVFPSPKSMLHVVGALLLERMRSGRSRSGDSSVRSR